MVRLALLGLLSHWRRNPVQAFTLIAGIALATALWTGVQAINQHARASFDQAASALGGGDQRRVINPSGRISTQTYVQLRREGIDVSPIVDAMIGHGAARARLLGFDPLTAPLNTAISLADSPVGPAEFLSSTGVVFANPATAGRLDDTQFNRIVTTNEAAPGFVFADISTALALADRDDGFDYLWIVADGPDVADRIGEIAPHLGIQEYDADREMSGLTESFQLNLTAFGFLSFAVGLFIVNGAVGLAIEQRRLTLRTLRILGVPLKTLLWALVLELTAFALGAGLAGVAMGYAIAAFLLPDVASTLRGLYGATVEGSLSLQASWMIGGIAMALFGTAIASLGAIFTIWRLPILAPARPRAWAMASQDRSRLLLGTAVVLGLISLLTSSFGSGLLAGFLTLGAGLLAAALCLPEILGQLLARFERVAKAPTVRWFWADSRQQLRGLSLSLMALLLAMATNIGVSTMVGSFRVTFVDWLDQRLASELYVTASSEEQADELLEFLETRADAVLPIWSAETDILGRPGEILSVADHPTYRQNWPMIEALPDVWERVFDSNGLLLNEQTARATRTWPGQTIRIAGTEFVVAGVYSDYGNPSAQTLISVDRFVRLFPQAERLNFGVRIPLAKIADLRTSLVEELGLTPDQFVDQIALKATSLAIFERTFAVSRILNVLTLGIAGVAILTALLTLSAMRLPQLAPVWALGLTRRRLATLELLRSLILAALTGVLALPVGLGLAWVLLEVINVQAFGWRLPLHLFPWQWAALWLAAVLAAGLASLWPAWQLGRIAPTRLIQVFSHER